MDLDFESHTWALLISWWAYMHLKKTVKENRPIFIFLRLKTSQYWSIPEGYLYSGKDNNIYFLCKPLILSIWVPDLQLFAHGSIVRGMFWHTNISNDSREKEFTWNYSEITRNTMMEFLEVFWWQFEEFIDRHNQRIIWFGKLPPEPSSPCSLLW